MCVLTDHEATTTPRNVDRVNQRLRAMGVWAPLSEESLRVAGGERAAPNHRITNTSAPTRDQVLAQLRHGPQTARQVAVRIGRAASTVTAALRELHADGVVAPDQPPKSGRAVRWELT
jgi:predicted Rossmann fold nucleotide-binding protein DprA/Smf involved in DNA uptake